MFTRIITLVILMALLSCSAPNKRTQATRTTQSTPGSQNGVFAQILPQFRRPGAGTLPGTDGKDKAIKQLEDQLNTLQRTEDDSTEAFTSFDEK